MSASNEQEAKPIDPNRHDRRAKVAMDRKKPFLKKQQAARDAHQAVVKARAKKIAARQEETHQRALARKAKKN